MALETLKFIIQSLKLKKASKYILVFSLMVFVVSCLAPTSKESYLQRFEEFVDRVEQNHKKYNHKDWDWADGQFRKYNHDWYLDYRDEFTLEDQIKIKSLIIKYHSLKNKQDLGEMLKELFKEDVDEISKKVEDYIEKDLDEDLDNLVNGLNEIGDSAVKVLEDVIKKLEETF